jgi:hypothetical protein
MFSIHPTIDAGLDYYTCVTLIDITKTDVARHYNKGMSESEAEYNLKRNQHRNYQTMLQVIGLRCQPTNLTDPIKHEDQDLTDLGFGSAFTNETVWSFTFEVEQEDVFLTANNPFGLLLDDMHNVPIVLNLTETADIDKAMLDTYNEVTKNTIILK